MPINLSRRTEREDKMNNSIVTSNQSLPTTVEDLSRFVLIGRDRLTAVRAAIRAIDKVGVAAEVRQQKLAEAQEIAEAVLDAEMRLGELRASVPRSAGGDRKSEKIKIRNDAKFESPLQEFDEKANIKKDDAARFEAIAKHPDIVEQAKADARDEGRIVTRQDVLNAISDEKKKPHIAYNSGNNEWYTPTEIIEAAREVMGSIDLDPASSDIANEVVKAGTYYTAEDNGLVRPWFGNIWLNPPYASDLIGRFIDRLIEARADYKQSIVLVNNATETRWFSSVVEISSAIVFPTSRVKFYMPNKQTGAPLQGQAILYIGDNAERFLESFSCFGWGAKTWKR